MQTTSPNKVSLDRLMFEPVRASSPAEGEEGADHFLATDLLTVEQHEEKGHGHGGEVDDHGGVGHLGHARADDPGDEMHRQHDRGQRHPTELLPAVAPGVGGQFAQEEGREHQGRHKQAVSRHQHGVLIACLDHQHGGGTAQNPKHEDGKADRGAVQPMVHRRRLIWLPALKPSDSYNERPASLALRVMLR